eukprot:2590916-Rhodomonas_salina.1
MPRSRRNKLLLLAAVLAFSSLQRYTSGAGASQPQIVKLGNSPHGSFRVEEDILRVVDPARPAAKALNVELPEDEHESTGLRGGVGADGS